MVRVRVISEILRLIALYLCVKGYESNRPWAIIAERLHVPCP